MFWFMIFDIDKKNMFLNNNGDDGVDLVSNKNG